MPADILVTQFSFFMLQSELRITCLLEFLQV